MNPYVFVFTDSPPDEPLPAGIIPVVKIADGTATVAAGFDFAANFAVWRTKYPDTIPWIYVYPDDTAPALLDIIDLHANGVEAVVYDIEQNVSHQMVAQLIAGDVASKRKSILSTWGLFGQAQQYQIPLAGFGWDEVWPQVYYAYQADGVEQYEGAHAGKLARPTVSPADWAGWKAATTPDVAPVFWRYGTFDIADVDPWLTSPAPTPAPTPTPTPSKDFTVNVTYPQIQSGDSGQAVRVWQGLLCALGHAVTIDSAFGPNTEAATKAYQASVGLAQDGIVGPETLGKALTV